jgi:hypothetical protein
MRVRRAGVRLALTALAAGATVPALAGAQVPEYGRCVKVTSGAARYGDTRCDTEGGERKYEWFVGPGPHPGFATIIKTGTSASLETTGGATVTCSGEASSGRVVGGGDNKHLAGVVIRLTSCEYLGARCSSGAVAGEMVTHELQGVLGVIHAGETHEKDTVGLALSPAAAGTTVIEATCGGAPLLLRGSVIARVRTNTMLARETVRFVATKGRQTPEGFEAGPHDVLEMSLSGSAFVQTGLTLTATRTDEEKLEVKTLPAATPSAPFEPISAAALPATGTPYVDGVADQNEDRTWGTYFPSFFRERWRPHIRIARYAVPWNVMEGGEVEKENYYLGRYLAWYHAAVEEQGLTPELAVTTYSGRIPASSTEYEAKVAKLLALKPVAYFEAWNEPNSGPLSANAVAAAHFWNAASALCGGYGCTTIAGDFLDGPGMAAYEEQYKAHLSGVPLDWGIHPYYAVKEFEASSVHAFESRLPAGAHIWFTEIGAKKCDHGKEEAAGEWTQAVQASYLATRLIPEASPVHVNYYEWLDGNPPPCETHDADSAIYLPGSDPNAPVYPRPAANIVFSGRGIPSAYTGAASAVGASGATITGSVYPGGIWDTHYHFEYGTTTSYGAYTPEADAGSENRASAVSAATGGLAPATPYHYRLVAWNRAGSSDEGPSYGQDEVFTTAPGSARAGSGSG